MFMSQVSSFQEGDIVLVCADESEVREKQRDHGEWIDTLRWANPGIPETVWRHFQISPFSCRMALGKRGRVAKVYRDGDIRIAISSQSWRLNPALVSIVNQVGIAESEMSQ